jgi:phosphoribosyl-AMP cyclohydrolase
MIKLTETFPLGGALPWIDVLTHLPFYADGLLPAIAHRHDIGEALRLAMMNQTALTETLATGRVCSGSRSRGCFWRKGETSGHIQCLKALRLDGEGDAQLPVVEPTGCACPTGRSTGFHHAVRGQRPEVMSQPIQGGRA